MVDLSLNEEQKEQAREWRIMKCGSIDFDNLIIEFGKQLLEKNIINKEELKRTIDRIRINENYTWQELFLEEKFRI